jgi:Holliday junction DNA helicase RuvA
MIASVRGKLASKGIDHVIVEVGGVGLRVVVSLQTLAELGGSNVGDTYLLTYLQVREDALTLFGFASESERAAFELCIGVQQVGPKLAMSILSTLTPEELARAVAVEDTARLKRIPGVGQKTAERLVLELRDKFPKAGPSAAPTVSQPSGIEAQVISALTNLGYRPSEAQKAAADAQKAAPQASVAELVKRALRALAE